MKLSGPLRSEKGSVSMRPSTIVAAIVIGAAALLSLSLHPILLGALEEAGQISKAGIGQAAMLELFGLALGGAVGGYWMGRGAMRLKVGAAALSLAAINIATAYADSAAMVLADRAIAGLLAGLLYGAANAIIVRSRNPDRLTGILVGASMAPAIALAYLTPVLLMPRFGLGVGFYLLAASMVLASLFVIGLVDRLSDTEQRDESRGRLSGALILFASALVLQSAGMGAAWAYTERLADQHSFGASVIGLAIAGSLASQVVAAWFSAWIAPATAKWPALLVLVVAQAGALALAIVTSSPEIFIAAVCIFGSAPAAAQAFQVSKIITLDATRATAVLVGPIILVGNGLGPLVASFATTDTNISGGFWAAVGMTGASAILYGASALWPPHLQPSAQSPPSLCMIGGRSRR